MTQKITDDTETLRKPGIMLAIVLAMIGWVFLLKNLPGAFVFSLSAVILVSISLIKPSLFVNVKKGWGFIFDILGSLMEKKK